MKSSIDRSTMRTELLAFSDYKLNTFELFKNSACRYMLYMHISEYYTTIQLFSDFINDSENFHI